VPKTVEALVTDCDKFVHPGRIRPMAFFVSHVVVARFMSSSQVLTNAISWRQNDENTWVKSPDTVGDGPTFPNRNFTASSGLSLVLCEVGHFRVGELAQSLRKRG
jgi:hypothetical protein